MKSGQEQFLSVDLGGTNLRLGRLNDAGDILERKALSADLVRRPEDLISVLKVECERMAAGGPVPRGLALGIPGLVDFDSGTVLQSPHFPLWQDVPLREELRKLLPFPVLMDNDANQAALGEAWKGAARTWQDFILVTLGTGIGGGIVTSGKIFRGPSSFAGEIGHIVIARRGRPDAVGIHGSLESFASQSGLKAILAEVQKSAQVSPEILALTPSSSDLPEALHRLAGQGDEAAIEIWRDFGNALGCGLSSLAHTLGIFRFVIGGGLSQAADCFFPASLEAARAASYPALRERIEVIRAALGADAGLVGGVPQILASLQS